MMTEADFSQLVLGKVPPTPIQFPVVNYDADGDCIEFLTTNESYYAKREDCLVTVYYSQETNQVVGSLIKGVRNFIRDVLKKAPGFKIEIRQGKIKLEHLFTARLWSGEGDPMGIHVWVYEALREAAERYNAEAEVGDVATLC